MTERMPGNPNLQPFDERGLFETARYAADDLLVDDDFLAQCREEKIDARVGYQPREFWTLAAQYARDRAATEAANGVEPSVGSMLAELTIAMPAYALDVQRSSDPSSGYDPAAAGRIYHYHTLVRTLAENEPRFSVKALADHLGKVAAGMLMQPQSVEPSAFHVAHEVVRGMQSELTFEHAMRAAGRSVRRTDQQADRAGIDYYFVTSSGDELPVDVKASTDELDELRGHATTASEIFALDWRRGRVLVSTLTGGRNRVNDQFFLSEELSEQLGVVLADGLDKAAYRLAHPEVFREIG